MSAQAGDEKWRWIPDYANNGCAVPGNSSPSVSVRGRCHMPWDVNYVLFGVLDKLCDLSDSLMNYVIRDWKWLHFCMNVLTAAAREDAGYLSWPTATTPDTTLTAKYLDNCPVIPDGPWSAVTTNRAVFKIVWKPGDPPFYIGCVRQ